uniref:Uncharacterized protein n=1 Tax=Anguilla anguilla TaxID=7936 RepID=A0A0E9UWW3_ANGAN
MSRRPGRQWVACFSTQDNTKGSTYVRKCWIVWGPGAHLASRI